MDTSNSTIAFVTDDGSTISSHFGRAQYYEIFTLRSGKIADRMHVSKAGHHSSGPGAHDEHGPPDESKHVTMTAPLTGVGVMVARGMGMGAQQHLIASGIQPILTEIHAIDEAVKHYLAGTLVNNPGRVHECHQH